MTIIVEPVEFSEIARMRDCYRCEMACQIIHDSIHERIGWTREYLIRRDGVSVGYGSVAVAGPWKDLPSIYEFYMPISFRSHLFDGFIALLQASQVSRIETQSNDCWLCTMLHTFASKIESEAILFQDEMMTSLVVPGAMFRKVEATDAEDIAEAQLDGSAGWGVEVDGKIVAAGDILYHYNRPYGDIYMMVAEKFRCLGLGSFLVQELKRMCYESGSIPAARCNVKNEASRKTLQRSGFVPCGHIVTGNVEIL